MSNASVFEFKKGQFAVTIFLTREMLKGFLPMFEQKSRSYRGEYQKTMKALVEASNEALIPKK